MDSLLQSTLVKVALPLFAILVTLGVSKARGYSAKDDLRLVWPRPSIMALWLVIWGIWIVVGEMLIVALDLDQARPWPPYPLAIVALRILAIGVMGPIAEELLMRGLVFFRLSTTRVGPHGAILICAVAWALMHVHYGWGTIGMIFLDGIVLGAARYRGDSLAVPMVMHVTGNLVSIAQSLNA